MLRRNACLDADNRVTVHGCVNNYTQVKRIAIKTLAIENHASSSLNTMSSLRQTTHTDKLHTGCHGIHHFVYLLKRKLHTIQIPLNSLYACTRNSKWNFNLSVRCSVEIDYIANVVGGSELQVHHLECHTHGSSSKCIVTHDADSHGIQPFFQIRIHVELYLCSVTIAFRNGLLATTSDDGVGTSHIFAYRFVVLVERVKGKLYIVSSRSKKNSVVVR